MTNEKQYSTPYLEGDVYTMQKLWKEKEKIKGEIESYDEEWRKQRVDPNNRTEEKRNTKLFKRGFPRTYRSLDQIPESYKAHNISNSQE